MSELVPVIFVLQIIIVTECIVIWKLQVYIFVLQNLTFNQVIADHTIWHYRNYSTAFWKFYAKLLHTGTGNLFKCCNLLNIHKFLCIATEISPIIHEFLKYQIFKKIFHIYKQYWKIDLFISPCFYLRYTWKQLCHRYNNWTYFRCLYWRNTKKFSKEIRRIWFKNKGKYKEHHTY